MMKGTLILLGVFVLGCATFAQGRRCYDCTYVKSSSSNSLLGTLDIESDPGCKDPGILTHSRECDSGDVCSYGNVDITTSFSFLGSVSFKVMTRGCADTFAPEGCYTADDKVKELVNGLVTSAFNTKVDGKVCFCDEDLCESYCGDGSVLLGENNCVENWVLVVAILIVVGFIAMVIGCLYACCKSSKSRGTVVRPYNNAGPIVVTNQSSQMAAAPPPAAYPQAPPQPYYQGAQPQGPPPAYPTGSHQQAPTQAYPPGAQEKKAPLPPNPQGAQPQAQPPAYPGGTQPQAAPPAAQPQAAPPADQPPPPPATYHA